MCRDIAPVSKAFMNKGLLNCARRKKKQSEGGKDKFILRKMRISFVLSTSILFFSFVAAQLKSGTLTNFCFLLLIHFLL